MIADGIATLQDLGESIQVGGLARVLLGIVGVAVAALYVWGLFYAIRAEHREKYGDPEARAQRRRLRAAEDRLRLDRYPLGPLDCPDHEAYR